MVEITRNVSWSLQKDSYALFFPPACSYKTHTCKKHEKDDASDRWRSSLRVIDSFGVRGPPKFAVSHRKVGSRQISSNQQGDNGVIIYAGASSHPGVRRIIKFRRIITRRPSLDSLWHVLSDTPVIVRSIDSDVAKPSRRLRTNCYSILQLTTRICSSCRAVRSPRWTIRNAVMPVVIRDRRVKYVWTNVPCVEKKNGQVLA